MKKQVTDADIATMIELRDKRLSLECISNRTGIPVSTVQRHLKGRGPADVKKQVRRVKTGQVGRPRAASAATVRLMRRLNERGFSVQQIAIMTDVCQATVRNYMNDYVNYPETGLEPARPPEKRVEPAPKPKRGLWDRLVGMVYRLAA